MDFSLLQADENFALENFFEAIIAEFKALGKEVVIQKKAKTPQRNVESAFLKENTEIYNLQFATEKRIKIKIEVDTQPPSGFVTEYKLLMLPFSFMTRCYSIYMQEKCTLFFSEIGKTELKGATGTTLNGMYETI
jgi:hypothetical protein